MKTQSFFSSGPLPNYVEQNFTFHVAAVPDAQNTSYRIEVQRQAGSSREYVLYYRPESLSLERVTRRDDGVEETVIQNSGHPFIYYERHLPIVPDFPVADPSGDSGSLELTVAGNRLVQRIQADGDRARISLERIEIMGSLRVTMEWAAGDPWWTSIECTENPLPTIPLPSEVVASGRLLGVAYYAARDRIRKPR
jgi:hypothetical protein